MVPNYLISFRKKIKNWYKRELEKTKDENEGRFKKKYEKKQERENTVEKFSNPDLLGDQFEVKMEGSEVKEVRGGDIPLKL